jgi:hypothetical protein
MQAVAEQGGGDSRQTKRRRGRVGSTGGRWQHRRSEGGRGRPAAASEKARRGRPRDSRLASDTDEHRARLKSGACWAVGPNSIWILLCYLGYD